MMATIPILIIKQKYRNITSISIVPIFV